MLKQFLSLWIDLKIWLRLRFLYQRNPLTRGIKSILPSNILLGKGVRIEKNTILSAHIESLGNHVYIGADTIVDYCRRIGNFSCISYGVKIGLRDHALDQISINPLFYSARRGWVDSDLFDEKTKGPVEIGSDVLISANAIILRGVKIGHGAVIGAGAVVLSDIPPYAIAAGVPAKIIRYRFEEETIQKLLLSRWWEKSDEQLRLKRKYFDRPVEFIKHLQEAS